MNKQTKKNVKVRDLKPIKDAKGGGGGFKPAGGGIAPSGGGVAGGGTAPSGGGIAGA